MQILVRKAMPRQEGMVVIGLNSAAGISFISDEISVKILLDDHQVLTSLGNSQFERALGT